MDSLKRRKTIHRKLTAARLLINQSHELATEEFEDEDGTCNAQSDGMFIRDMCYQIERGFFNNSSIISDMEG
jgi:hypothetical protein